MAKGFFVPGTTSQNYVSNKKNAEGDYQYDKAYRETGLAQQSALNTINKNYASTIENAYSSYLSANRSIRGGGMGMGYKEAYLAQLQEGLDADIAETNRNTKNVRMELGANVAQQMSGISDAFNTEVSYMDRIASGANSYLGYLKTLTHKDNMEQTYLQGEDLEASIDTMYDKIFSADIGTMKSYMDAQGNAAMGYLDWMNSQFKDTEADRAFSKWYYGGGLQQFKNATKKGIKDY